MQRLFLTLKEQEVYQGLGEDGSTRRDHFLGSQAGINTRRRCLAVLRRVVREHHQCRAGEQRRVEVGITQAKDETESRDAAD